jgi:hypothetical protein
MPGNNYSCRCSQSGDGFGISLHSSYGPLYKDLELGKYGVEYIGRIYKWQVLLRMGDVLFFIAILKRPARKLPAFQKRMRKHTAN